MGQKIKQGELIKFRVGFSRLRGRTKRSMYILYPEDLIFWRKVHSDAYKNNGYRVLFKVKDILECKIVAQREFLVGQTWCAFRIKSATKSTILYASTEKERESWIKSISDAARQLNEV